ncbi:electron transfer flavoprotein subunit alpha/FixB family protein [bacterium]|nr:electron transfer flavoprotein subunit alpha/FixB family protein [candidate division CSSED10-310 bacterium]
MSAIVIWAEVKDGTVRKSALEAIHAAGNIAGDNPVHAVIIGSRSAAETLSEYPVQSVLHVHGSDYLVYQSETYTDAVFTAIDQLHADTVIIAATALGRDLSARLAARMDAALATDVTAIQSGDHITVTRSIYSGKVMADVDILAPRAVITIRPNVFDTPQPTGHPAVVHDLSPSLKTIRAVVREALASAQDTLDVTEADIIVSGGRGVGGPDGFKVIDDIARSIGAAVGASRVAVDEGWIPYKHQVGQTGKVVSPVLYIACGISGAIQHFAGMGSARFIIAINSDPEAPIMKKADFAIVGDLFKVLPVLQEELKKILNR